MPIYEWNCPIHGTFEKYSPRILENDEEFTNCVNDQCPRVAKRQISLTAMHPDKYWSGVTVQGQYVTSSREAKSITKDLVPYNRDNAEYIQKKKTENEKALQVKKKDNLEKFLRSELASVTADPDNNHILSDKTRKKQISNY